MKEIFTIFVFVCLALFSVKSQAFYTEQIQGSSPLKDMADIHRNGEPVGFYFAGKMGIAVCPDVHGEYSPSLRTNECITLYYGTFSELCNAQIENLESVGWVKVAFNLGTWILMPPAGAIRTAISVGGSLYGGKAQFDVLGAECTPEGIKKGDDYLDNNFVEELIKHDIRDGDTVAILDESATGLYVKIKQLFPTELPYPVGIVKLTDNQAEVAYEIRLKDTTSGLAGK